ncbi:MAG: FkbM family methyltransferase [Hyphomicrobiales bacterium]|nr:FkbM family methyltransferase [Hyphomicrobiales bacterium]
MRIKRFFQSSAGQKYERSSQIVTFNNAAIICRRDNKIEHELICNSKNYDAQNFAVMKAIVRPGSNCFDIGANIGVYSMVMSRIAGFEGAIHAFEPVNHIRKRLLQNKSLNGARNIIVNNFALGDLRGEMEMFQVKKGEFRGGTSTFVRNNNVESMGAAAFERAPVRVDTLDNYARATNLPSVDFLKIDVEGFEINVFRGAQEVISKHHPAILFEHDQKRLSALGVKDEDFKQILFGVGYSLYEPLLRSGMFRLLPFVFDRRMVGNNLLALHSED